MRSLLLLIYVLMAVVSGVHPDVRTACSDGEHPTVAPAPPRGESCVQVSPVDLEVSRGDRLPTSTELLTEVTRAARLASIDPTILLAVLIRESGDAHSFDWLARTPVGWMQHFSVGIANMEYSAFEEAQTYAHGVIDFTWSAIQTDPDRAILAAAFLLAKRTSQLSPLRSRQFSDAEYVRVGYRAGYDIMHKAEISGEYPPGVQLFDLAYDRARQLIYPTGRYRPTLASAIITSGRTVCDRS
jgi:hypothetical protein